MNWFIKPHFVCLAIIVMAMTLLPSHAFCFWDEDSLKIAGITAGATLALGILIVLIAGTMQDVKGDDDEELSSKNKYLCSLEGLLLPPSVNPFIMKPAALLYQDMPQYETLSPIPLDPETRCKYLHCMVVLTPFPAHHGNDEYYMLTNLY